MGNLDRSRLERWIQPPFAFQPVGFLAGELAGTDALLDAHVLVVVALLASGACILWLAFRPNSQSLRMRSAAAVTGVGLAFFLWHSALTPAIDSFKDMSRGARELAKAVPDEEQLIGLALDETTRAVVPFYSQRLIRSLATPTMAIDELDAGTSHHLVIMDRPGTRMDAQLIDRLHAVRTVRLSATRSVTVYIDTKRR